MDSKGQLIAPSTTQSLRALLPKGYVVFTEEGAKKALKTSVDLSICQYREVQKDSIISHQNDEIDAQKSATHSAKNAYTEQVKATSKVKRKLFIRTTELIITLVGLGTKLIGIW